MTVVVARVDCCASSDGENHVPLRPRALFRRCIVRRAERNGVDRVSMLDLIGLWILRGCPADQLLLSGELRLPSDGKGKGLTSNNPESGLS